MIGCITLARKGNKRQTCWKSLIKNNHFVLLPHTLSRPGCHTSILTFYLWFCWLGAWQLPAEEQICCRAASDVCHGEYAGSSSKSSWSGLAPKPWGHFDTSWGKLCTQWMFCLCAKLEGKELKAAKIMSALSINNLPSVVHGIFLVVAIFNGTKLRVELAPDLGTFSFPVHIFADCFFEYLTDDEWRWASLRRYH